MNICDCSFALFFFNWFEHMYSLTFKDELNIVNNEFSKILETKLQGVAYMYIFM